MNRSLFWSILTIVILLAASSMTLIFIHPLKLLNSNNIPDSYIRNFRDQIYDSHGTLKCIINSPKLIHYHKPDIAFLNKPDIVFFHGDAPWYINALHGKSESANSKITLWGNVVIKNMGSKTQTPTQLNTQKIIIYPQRSLAQSSLPVIITQPSDIIKGTGFTANFKTGKLTLLHNARGKYHALSIPTH